MTVNTAQRRWKQHVNDSKKEGCNCALHAAIRKYGPEQFTLQVLELHERREQLAEAEIRLIDVLQTMHPQGYNLTPGGEGVTRLPPELEARRVAKSAQTRTGMKLTEAHRAALRKAHIGQPSPRKGVALTEEQRQRMRQSAKLRWANPDKREVALASIHSPEARALRSKSQAGKPKSEEVKAKLKDAAIRRFAKPEEREAARQRTLAFQRGKRNGA
jgi:group I intron endonuclease